MVFFYLWEKHFTSTRGKINHMIRRPRVLPDVRDRHPDQDHLQKDGLFCLWKKTLYILQSKHHQHYSVGSTDDFDQILSGQTKSIRYGIYRKI
jgi:hypothetical protein